jgi:hypothetical protein
MLKMQEKGLVYLITNKTFRKKSKIQIEKNMPAIEKMFQPLKTLANIYGVAKKFCISKLIFNNFFYP